MIRLIQIGMVLIFISFMFSASSQNAGRTSYLNSDSLKIVENNTDVYRYDKRNEVIQSTGRTYNSFQMQQMAAKDINQIANTVPGVQYRVGEPLTIRGTNQGTAYYVDGVRIYGALPVLIK